MSIVEFLTARLDEDEREARRDYAENLEVAYDRRYFPGRTLWSLQGEDSDGCAITAGRVLREVEAKRAIVAEHELQQIVPRQTTLADLNPRYRYEPWWRCLTCGDYDICPTLRALAAVYADHPDYDETWRP